MAKAKPPKGFPDCDLIKTLSQRVSQKTDSDFNFFGHLGIFRKRVSDEVSQINLLFPEYTPHDEAYHLKNLFHVASTVLGTDCLEQMNCAELYVLAVSLYGHDWGMAVSEPEKEYILTGKCPDEASKEKLWILPNEREQILQFSRDNRIPIQENDVINIADMPLGSWREYVRQTHASRSAERVRKHFEPIDGGVADAASRVCVGHCLDFEKLEDHRAYPTDFSVQGEKLNLLALTVYLRLIDLLDLAEDRTPYVIWKFVAPRDEKSRMEWAKHRSLRPVACNPYQQGRVIQVDGSTDDHEVYAALEDLRHWCDDQLRGCNDLLARMNDERLKLDIFHIDWRVAPRGFEPVLIRFEFHRERMFQILSDEIYQSDPYVFLRELLQNSIDAIRMRREVLQRQGLASDDMGTIEIEVAHGKGGNAVITCRDDGIGIDEYVVRNYLAVAGKSYYRSEDFERMGLSMDPISRFGVGLLSCFMVADRVEIDTYKDPYLQPPGDPLKIVIPSVERQFRIEKTSRDNAKVGTTVRVSVKGSKLSEPLKVTEYIKTLAGFVDFPIVITEGETKTVVLHPSKDPSKEQDRFGDDFKIYQTKVTFPWSQALVPQDVSLARALLEEEKFSLSEDLGLEGCEGYLNFLVPREDDVYLDISGYSYDVYRIIDGREGTETDMQLRLKENWAQTRFHTRSAHTNLNCNVYKDGILVPEASENIHLFDRHHGLNRANNCQIVINITKRAETRTDIARLSLRQTSEHWRSKVSDAFLRRLSETRLKDIAKLNPPERFFELTRVMCRYGIDREILLQVFPRKKWPIVCLDQEGRLQVIEWDQLCEDVLYMCPGILNSEIERAAKDVWINPQKYSGPLQSWSGDRCIVDHIGESLPLSEGNRILWTLVRESHALSGVRFLRPPWSGDPPLVQGIWGPRSEGEEKYDLEKLMNTRRELSGKECQFVLDRCSYGLPKVVDFPSPYETQFGYGRQYMNGPHPTTQALTRLMGERLSTETPRCQNDADLGRFDDLMDKVFPSPLLSISGRVDWHEVREGFRKVCVLAREIGFLHAAELEQSLPTADDFVPGTTGPDALKLRKKLSEVKDIRDFGHTLS